MRRAVITSSIFLIVLASLSFAQGSSPTPTPQKRPILRYTDVLNAFRVSKWERRSTAEINSEVLQAAKTSRIDILLTDEARKELKDAGASDEVIKIIDDAISPEEKKRIFEMNRVYQIVLDNYRSADVQTFRLAIKAAEEFLDRFSTEVIAQDIVTWLKNNLPRWKSRINDFRSVR